MIRRTLLAAVISGVAWLTIPSAALASTQSAQLGAIKATLSFTATKNYHYEDLRLQITNSGEVLYNEPVKQSGCSPFCEPQYTGRHTSAVRVLDLEAGSPDVVLELYSGGAHCCSYIEVFTLDPGTMTYSQTSHNFGNPGAAIKQEAGQWVFITNDNDFYYEFTDYVDSGAPIQVYRFFDKKFALVTRNYPRLIKNDARELWTAFTHDYSNGDGLIAAWAADEDLLGNFHLVQSLLKSELKAHHLNSPGPPWARGQKFIEALNEFLVKLGYQAGPG